MWQKLCILAEKQKRADREELWRVYMANIVPMWGAPKTYADAVDEYEAAMKPQHEKQKDIQKAYDVANATLAALEKSRRG